MDSVEIIQQNRRGPGRLASRALALAVGLLFTTAFLVAITAIFIARALSGTGSAEDVVAFVLFPPVALILLIVAAFELSAVLPRRLRINAVGIHVHFSPWCLRPGKCLLRLPGQHAQAVKQRHSNYVTYASGNVSDAPIVSNRFVVRYGRGWFGPVDEDQLVDLTQAINNALERTSP